MSSWKWIQVRLSPSSVRLRWQRYWDQIRYPHYSRQLCGFIPTLYGSESPVGNCYGEGATPGSATGTTPDCCCRIWTRSTCQGLASQDLSELAEHVPICVEEKLADLIVTMQSNVEGRAQPVGINWWLHSSSALRVGCSHCSSAEVR